MLTELGWTDTWEAAWRAIDPELELEPVRIVAEHRGAYHAMAAPALDSAPSESRLPPGVGWVELTGRAFHDAPDKLSLPTVGDWVLVEGWATALAGRGAAVIRHVLDRHGLLVRKAAGEATAPQPLAANVDVGIMLTSANRDLSPARIDRYLGLLRDGGIAPALVLSKIDLVADPEPQLAVLREVSPTATVLGVSATTGAGLEAVRALAGPGRTIVLLGSSGVGKSSLLNALLGQEIQLTQPIREDERGRHTTTRREMFVTASGAWIDTPGMRELAQWIDETDETVFDDVTALAQACRFRDCHHQAEPACAVRAAVESGALPRHRLASFHKLADERATGTTRKQVAERIAEARSAKLKKLPPK